MRAVPTRGSVLASGESGAGGGSGRRRARRALVALQTVPLFDGVSRRHLRRLAAESDVVSFGAGRPIVEQGQPGEAMFVVLGGTARVERFGRKVGGLLPGDFFGELSALDGGPRTASVVPETPMEVLRVYRHTLRKMIEEEPGFGMGLLEGIARRLRQVIPASPTP